jgi:hypothetical protein
MLRNRLAYSLLTYLDPYLDPHLNVNMVSSFKCL